MGVIALTPKNYARAVRYRQLALAEPDRDRADLLLKLADEADRDVLCTSDWCRSSPSDGAAMKPLKQDS
jgi:hypothetical protein